jgi:SAM-dependent methyltransferase
MGLNEHFLGLMIGLKEKGYLHGQRVMEMGAQQLSDAFLRDRADQEKLAAMFGKDPAQLPDLPRSAEGIAPGDEPHSRTFFEALGYEYACVDIDGTAETLVLDLNYDDVPPANRGRYDLVTNFGTTEHVINQLNAFKIIHDLTAPGGVMIHELPTQGLIDHGLVAYNPKFFRMLGENNGYETLFYDFRWTEIRSVMTPGMRDEIENYISTIGRPLFGISEAVLFVAQRKIKDTPFVPPLDVPYGTKAPSAVLADRYWPVFKPQGGIKAFRRKLKRLIILMLIRQ